MYRNGTQDNVNGWEEDHKRFVRSSLDDLIAQATSAILQNVLKGLVDCNYIRSEKTLLYKSSELRNLVVQCGLVLNDDDDYKTNTNFYIANMHMFIKIWTHFIKQILRHRINNA